MNPKDNETHISYHSFFLQERSGKSLKNNWHTEAHRGNQELDVAQ